MKGICLWGFLPLVVVVLLGLVCVSCAPVWRVENNRFENGLAVVEKWGRKVLVHDDGGVFELQPSCRYFLNLANENRIPFFDSSTGLYGYADYEGNVVIGSRYTFAGAFRDGKALAATLPCRTSRLNPVLPLYWIDLQGDAVAPGIFTPLEELRRRFPDCAIAALPNGNFFVSVLDEHNQPLSVALWDREGRERKRLTGVDRLDSFSPEDDRYGFYSKSEKRYGFINAQGDVVIAPNYQAALPFSGGRAWVSEQEWHEDGFFIDTAGNRVFDYNLRGRSLEPGFEGGWLFLPQLGPDGEATPGAFDRQGKFYPASDDAFVNTVMNTAPAIRNLPGHTAVYLVRKNGTECEELDIPWRPVEIWIFVAYPFAQFGEYVCFFIHPWH